jgi:hypothetical protein
MRDVATGRDRCRRINRPPHAGRDDDRGFQFRRIPFRRGERLPAAVFAEFDVGFGPVKDIRSGRLGVPGEPDQRVIQDSFTAESAESAKETQALNYRNAFRTEIKIDFLRALRALRGEFFNS